MPRKNMTSAIWLASSKTLACARLKESGKCIIQCGRDCILQSNFPTSMQIMCAMCNQQSAGCSDEVLLQAVTKKDGTAFELLYDRHAPFIYNLLMCIVRSESVAEDLLQETFWQVWQKAGQYSGRGAGVAWIHQIARHKALDQLRCQKARPAIMTNDIEALEWAMQHEPSAESEFEQNWTRQQVQQALEHIPREQRLCLELAYFEGLSHQEIAVQTNTPLGTIKTRIRIGMKKLERDLLSRGYSFMLPNPRHCTPPESN